MGDEHYTTTYGRIERIEDCVGKTISAAVGEDRDCVGMRFDEDRTYFFAEVRHVYNGLCLYSASPYPRAAHALGLIDDETCERALEADRAATYDHQKEQERKLFLELKAKFEPEGAGTA